MEYELLVFKTFLFFDNLINIYLVRLYEIIKVNIIWLKEIIMILKMKKYKN
jgi:hypothetical protein